MKKLLVSIVCLMVLVAFTAYAEDSDVDDRLKEIEKRLMQVERKAATDRIEFTGDFRYEAHGINTDMSSYVDGMMMQSGFADAIMYVNYGGGAWPQNPGEIPGFMGGLQTWVNSNFGDYYAFNQTFTFEDLGAGLMDFGMNTPADVQQMIQEGMAQAALVQAYPWDTFLQTNRLRLNMKAKIARNVSFAGRLAMYKVWGGGTGVQVFNGQPNSINIDGTSASVPNSDILRVERAYFDWKNIGGVPIYLSVGRRPSTGGPPLHLRQDEPRGGTPLGLVVDFQFDGATLGWHISDESTLRLCYGVGYSSGFGSAEQLKQPADRLKDANLLGLNWDIINSERMYIQGTWAHAFDVTDGFNGLVVLPNNPVTGKPIGAPVIMRYTPSANLGDIDLASLLLLREDGPLDWFVSYSHMWSDPNNVTTPFGGLFADPFVTPEKQNAGMVYLGARYNFKDDKTKIGLEYNWGDEYWFNFALASDDIIMAKTSTRGSVIEGYLTYRIFKKFIVKADYIYYNYKYSGSGWNVGGPKELDTTPPPVLGFPTYKDASKIALSFMARF